MADSFEALVSLPKFSVHSSPPFDSVHPEHFLGLAQLPAASPRPADHHMAPPQVSRNYLSRPSVHPTVTFPLRPLSSQTNHKIKTFLTW